MFYSFKLILQRVAFHIRNSSFFIFQFINGAACLFDFSVLQEHDEQPELREQVEESRRQEEVLQKELYDNMLRISALEAQLDRYRHGLDENALSALERSEAEERKMKEEALHRLEDKEQEVGGRKVRVLYRHCFLFLLHLLLAYEKVAATSDGILFRCCPSCRRA